MALEEYPRPQLKRNEYRILNGAWDFCVRNDPEVPEDYPLKIQVPYSPEAKLSGVCRQTMPGEYLFYRRECSVPEEYSNKHLLLHFGASDYLTDVFVNGKHVLSHVGGYLPFSVDVTDFVEGASFYLTVRVRDDSDTSYHSRGKQKLKRGGIWYTPQSGIWQTVWMEPVPDNYIRSLRIVPDFDNAVVEIGAELSGEGTACALWNGKTYALPARIPVPDAEPWTPENPVLHPFTVQYGEDSVESYFAMRKFSVGKDEQGIPRLMLNNLVYFHQGLLDQGYWEDGLYTPPSDQAMIDDIRMAKRMGFNMLRKHIKVEPLRFYYHCDKLGMIVWQDMINGGGKYSFFTTILPLFTGLKLSDWRYWLFSRSAQEGRAEFEKELKTLISHLFNCPCIGLWTIFNEGWGQFDATRLYRLVKTLDPTRPVDPASGWHDQGEGDVVSSHVYFRKYHFKEDRKGRCVVLSEFGGYNLRIPGHCFNEKNFGYRGYRTAEQLLEGLRELYEGQIKPTIPKGLSGAVYTQLSDVEDELNGLVTYDREVIKVEPEKVRTIISN